MYWNSGVRITSVESLMTLLLFIMSARLYCSWSPIKTTSVSVHSEFITLVFLSTAGHVAATFLIPFHPKCKYWNQANLLCMIQESVGVCKDESLATLFGPLYCKKHGLSLTLFNDIFLYACVIYVRSRVQKFPAWHTKAAPNGKLMYQLKSVLK